MEIEKIPNLNDFSPFKEIYQVGERTFINLKSAENYIIKQERNQRIKDVPYKESDCKLLNEMWQCWYYVKDKKELKDLINRTECDIQRNIEPYDKAFFPQWFYLGHSNNRARPVVTIMSLTEFEKRLGEVSKFVQSLKGGS